MGGVEIFVFLVLVAMVVAGGVFVFGGGASAFRPGRGTEGVVQDEDTLRPEQRTVTEPGRENVRIVGEEEADPASHNPHKT